MQSSASDFVSSRHMSPCFCGHSLSPAALHRSRHVCLYVCMCGDCVGGHMFGDCVGSPVWGLCGGSHVWGCVHPCMHVWGRETVAERRSCIAALPSLSMMLLRKPVVWTCQYERAVCVYHAGIPFLLSEQCITSLLVDCGSSARRHKGV